VLVITNFSNLKLFKILLSFNVKFYFCFCVLAPFCMLSFARGWLLYCNVTDLMKALPGNSSVNTAQHATIDEPVLSMLLAPSTGRTMGLCNLFLSNGSVNTLPRKRWRHQQQRRCFPWGLCMVLIREVNAVAELNPCGGGVEYLHRDPASRKRRQNGAKKGRAIA
jgi:hypothetical protein